MHVVVTSFGSDGDFNPLLAIAAALVRRGVAVTFVANPFYERRITAVGCRFVGAGAFLDVFAVLEANPRYLSAPKGLLAIWNELAKPSIRETYPVVRDAISDRGATVVVSHVGSFGGAWAAAETGARSVVVTTSPAGWLSRHHPIIWGNWLAPRAVQAFLTMAVRSVGGAALRQSVRRLAVELDAPPIADIVRDADLNIGVWPEWFRATAPDDPPRARTCGFVFDALAAAAPLPAGVEAFLAAGDAPVIAGFGSAASLHGADRYRAVASACDRLGARCLLIGASAAAVPPDANVLTVASLPYARVFPAASVIVHHGGFGTCAEALRAGKPSLVTPFAFDQFDTAARVQDAGLGCWLRGSATDAELLATRLDAMLRRPADAAAPAAAAATIVGDPTGADRAAELIAAL